jgi:cysteine desulfurase
MKNGGLIMKTIYFDHCAATPVLPEVSKVYTEISKLYFANTSSLHSFGLEAKKIIDQSRKCISDIFNVKEEEIIFTSGATESNNLAILGTIKALKSRVNYPLHVIVSVIEHPSVINCYKQLEKEGIEVSYLPVNDKGVVSLDDVKSAIKKNTVLISIMHVNNETGSIQPISEIADYIKSQSDIIIHVDGVQGFGKVDLDLTNIDLYTISGHKLGGIKGNGILMARKEVSLSSIMYGGNQEYGIRPGTIDVAGVRALEEAIRISYEGKSKRLKKLISIHNLIYSSLEVNKNVVINNLRWPNSAPHIINFSYPGISSAILIKMLDMYGIIVSSQSACSSGLSESRILKEMYNNRRISTSSIRISFDESISLGEVEYLIDSINKVLSEYPSENIIEECL